MHAEILNKDQYNKWSEFAYAHPYSSIHQTPTWGRFQGSVPSRDRFWIVAIFERESDHSKSNKNPSKENRIVAGTLLIKHKLPQKNLCWLYAPRGPLLSYEDPREAKQQMKMLLEKIKEIAKQENAVFLRVDPLLEKPTANFQPTANSQLANNPQSTVNSTTAKPIKFPHFHSSRLGFQPNTTLILDITKPESEILAQMKPKGRYNIKLAQKHGVEIVEVKPPNLKSPAKSAHIFNQQVKAYYDILQETLSRDKFYGHAEGFYKSMLEKLAPSASTTIKPSVAALAKQATTAAAITKPTAAATKLPATAQADLRKGFAKMYLATYTDSNTHHNHPIAGLIATFYKDTAIYYYGASSDEHRNVMAPYLLQWHAIQQAKSLNMTNYDFLGIADSTPKHPNGDPSHPWHGVTEFKLKFGGRVVNYQFPQEYTFKPFLHMAYALTKHARKLVKKFKK